MKRLAILILLAVTGATLARAHVPEEAPAARPYVVQVGDFTQLSVLGALNVDYVCSADSAGMAVYTATDGQAPLIGFDNNGKGRLRVRLLLEKDQAAPAAMPTVRVYSRALERADNQADSTLRLLRLPAAMARLKGRVVGNGSLVVRDVDASAVDLGIDTGRGSITAYGRCQNASYTVTGKGTIQADRLQARDVKCSLFGAGTVGCRVDGGTLTLVGLSTATVWVYGHPSQIKNRSVGLKVNLEDP